MKRYIRSSAGDIQLSKFIFIPTDKISNVCEDKYVDNIHGYLWIWSYTYNTLTHHTDDRLYAHSDVIDELPTELRRLDRIWGRVDWFKDRKRFFINDEESLTSSQLNYIKRKCNV